VPLRAGALPEAESYEEEPDIRSSRVSVKNFGSLPEKFRRMIEIS
jgi:hypothetical protein